MSYYHPVYHYTTIFSLEKILESKKLKLSSCKNYKGKGGEDAELLCVLERNIKDKIFRKSLCRFLEIHQHYSCKNKSDEEIIKAIVNIRENSYMACFSRTRKNETLWKNFACDGCGVVIEFDGQYIDYDEIPITVGGPEGRSTERRWVKMEYDDEKFVKCIKGFHDQEVCNLVFYIDSYKNPQYKDEKESRLLLYCSPNNKGSADIDEYTRDGKKINRCFTKKGDAVYLELETTKFLCLNYDNSHAIKKIYCRKPYVKKKVEELIKDLKIEQERTVKESSGSLCKYQGKGIEVVFDENTE